MLRLLLDENISYVVADGLAARRPEIMIMSVHRWRDGELRGQPDPFILQAAAQDGMTLVTFDVSTIRPLISEWRALGLNHAGVILVDERTIKSRDFGGLIRGLEALWDREQSADWINRIEFLRPV